MTIHVARLRALLANAEAHKVILPLRREGPDGLYSKGGYVFDMVKYQSYSHHYEHSKDLVVAAVNALPKLLDAYETLHDINNGLTSKEK